MLRLIRHYIFKQKNIYLFLNAKITLIYITCNLYENKNVCEYFYIYLICFQTWSMFVQIPIHKCGTN